jgi:hypothetical protein
MSSGAFIRYGSVGPPPDSIFDRENSPASTGQVGPPECRTQKGSLRQSGSQGRALGTALDRDLGRLVSRAGLAFGRRARAGSPWARHDYPAAMSPTTAGSGTSISKVSRIGTSGRKTTTNTATIAAAIPTQKLDAIAIDTES